MCAILLDRQDSRHVGETDVRLILEPVAQEVEILPLRCRIVRIFAEDAVPFVDDDDEEAMAVAVNRFHYMAQAALAEIRKIRIFLQQFPEQGFLQKGKQLFHIARLAQELLHIETDDVTGVAIFREAFRLLDGQPLKNCCTVDRAVIVSAEHVRRHRLAEAARTAHAQILLLALEETVRLLDHCRLIHIDFRMQRLLEHFRAGIEINAHDLPPV